MIRQYQNLWQKIMKLDSIQHYDAIYLDCGHLKNSLASTAYKLSQMLLHKVADDHRKENQLWAAFCILFYLLYAAVSKTAVIIMQIWYSVVVFSIFFVTASLYRWCTVVSGHWNMMNPRLKLSYEGAARVRHFQPRIIIFQCRTNDRASYVLSYDRLSL